MKKLYAILLLLFLYTSAFASSMTTGLEVDGDGSLLTGITATQTGALPLSGGTMSGQINMGSQRIVNMQDPVDAQDAVTVTHLNHAIASLGLTEYFRMDASTDIPGYFQLSETPGADTMTSAYLLASTNDQLVFVHATEPGLPGLDLLVAGTYIAYTNLYKTGTKDVAIYYTLSKRDVLGNETLLGTSTTTDLLTTLDVSYNIPLTLSSQITLDLTDRLVIKFYANAGTGNVTTVSMDGTGQSNFSIKRSAAALNEKADKIVPTVPGNMAGLDQYGNLQDNGFIATDEQDPTGFIDPANIGIAYDSTARTVTLTHSSGSIDYYYNGIKKSLVSAWTSTDHSSSNGIYYLYSSDGTNFVWANSFPGTAGKVLVATAHYNASYKYGTRESHGLMPWQVHSELHSVIGTYLGGGGAVTAATYTLSSASDSNTRPGFDAATIVDEDLTSTVPAVLSPVYGGTYYTTFYVGAGSTSVFDTTATFPFRSSGSYILVNNPSTGTETAGTNNTYVNIYQVLVPATTDAGSQAYRMLFIQPQTSFSDLTSAQAEDSRSLSLNGLSSAFAEFTIYTRLTYKLLAGNLNTGKCTLEGISYVFGTKQGQVSSTGFMPGPSSSATYIVQTPNSTIPNAQAISALSTGILKGTTATGVISIAANTDLSAIGGVITDQSTPQTIGLTGARLSKLWTTDLDVTNTITGSISGNAATVTGLSVVSGKTLTVQKSMTLTSPDDTSVSTLPAGTHSLLATDGSIAGLTGTISSTVLGNSTLYVGTTAIALNRGSASQSLTGITSIDGSAATLTTARAINGVDFNGSAPITVPVNNANDATNADYFALFTSTQGGNYAALTSTGFKYHPSTGILTATGFSGPLNGTVGATTPAAGKFTTLESTNIAALTTIAESWIGPSSTAGIYFKGGNVGIGTTSPGARLELYDGGMSAGSLLTLQTDDENPWFFQMVDRTYSTNLANGFKAYQDASGGLHLYNMGTDTLDLKSGNVGIGTTNPTTKLQVSGTGNITNSTVSTNSGGNAYVSASSDTSGIQLASFGSAYSSPWTGQSGIYLGATTPFNIWQGANNRLMINSSGNVGIGTTSPASLTEIQGGLTTTGAILTLSSKEPSTVANDVLGRVNFRAALDASGGDANLVGASIVARAEGTFSATNNATSLVFQTGASETATDKMTLTSAGALSVTGTINGLTLTAAATGFTIAGGTTSKTLTQLKTMSFTAADDTGVYTFPTGTKTLVSTDASNIAFTGGTIAGLTSLGIRDSIAAYDLTLASASTTTLTAGRTLTFDVGNTSSTIQTGWTTPTFNAGNFTANGSMTWTVSSATTYRYQIVGQTMFLNCSVTGAVGGTPSTQLKIKIPAGKVSSKYVAGYLSIFNNGSLAQGFYEILAGSDTIILYVTDAGGFWTAGTAGANGDVFTFEIN